MTAASFSGSCSFRMMPFDTLQDAPSSAELRTVAASQTALAYTWTHPHDGPQQGVLLVGGAAEGSAEVTAAWADSWHQAPDLMVLTGMRTAARVEVRADYSGDWSWEISLAGLDGDSPTMTMRNVVPGSALETLPPDAPRVEAGPYDVMVARWHRDPTR